MQNAINFCSHAINKETPHFYIKDKRIYAYNGAFAMSAPLDLPDCSPKAEQLIGAFKNQTTASVTKTPTGKLSIKNGKLKALVNCSETFMVNTDLPNGEVITSNCDLPTVLKRLLPFTIESKQPNFGWMKGLILENGFAYATNSAIIIRHVIGIDFKIRVWLSPQLIKAILKIKEPIIDIVLGNNTITFRYADEKYISQKFYDGNIPDLDSFMEDLSCEKELHEDFFTGIDYIKPFVDENFLRVIISPEGLSTSDGTIYNLPLDGNGSYHLENLLLLRDIITHIDFDKNTFTGVDIQGKICGYRD